MDCSCALNLDRVLRAQRVCPHCNCGAVDGVSHVTLHCTFYSAIRGHFPDLFSCVPDPAGPLALSTFLSCHTQPVPRLAEFATPGLCSRS